ncbi:hypothetical protein Y032_0302g1875 [Ancylostoma ceylanicum]|uniref:Uncharacterized protein n=1 Tax=Ancylostoma ceylanicum TaxID=53326 RepID=A0A016S454_9BILA|nr:hypothetical protein Y032_0302g1875 [Ancylostoma ceylanicum]
MAIIVGDDIDLLILSILSQFCSETGKDVSTRVLQCAEDDYDNHFGRCHRFIDFIDFSTYARELVKTCQVGFFNMPNTNMTTILRESID